MFDFRYHVVSLAAVFLALVIGILVGIGLSGKGFVDDAERKNLQQEIGNLRNDLAIQQQSAEAATSRLLALQDLADAVGGPLEQGRLEGVRVALVYVGGVPGPVNQAVRRAIGDAGGRVVKMATLRVPLDGAALDRALSGRPALRSLVGWQPSEQGRAVGMLLLHGGAEPFWKATGSSLVAERSGDLASPADAVVVARAVPAQPGATARFLAGLYTTIGAAGLPAAGVQEAGAGQSSVSAFARQGLSTVDSVDTAAGRLALVWLLAGGDHGHYGVEETATDGILPAFDSLPR